MIELDIPGRGQYQITDVVFDVNGTLAKDGRLLDRIAKLLAALREQAMVHLLTANTYLRQDNIDLQLGLQSVRLTPGDEARQKAEFVRRLGAEHVIAIGQGANDADMLKAAAIGIAVLGDEGLALEAALGADVVAASIYQAFDLLQFPTRLVATLRR